MTPSASQVNNQPTSVELTIALVTAVFDWIQHGELPGAVEASVYTRRPPRDGGDV